MGPNVHHFAFMLAGHIGIQSHNNLNSSDNDGSSRKSYSCHFFQQVLIFMNCKPHHAKAISHKVFDRLVDLETFTGDDLLSFIVRERVILVSKRVFMKIACQEISSFCYGTDDLKQNLQITWRIKDNQNWVCILLGGTSGCGKSTLATLLARRYRNLRSLLVSS
jgi:2-phosphoglycerate kinase